MNLLVVVDYQYDFVAGSLGFDRAKALDEGICRTAKAYLAAGDSVVFTLDTHGENYLETQEGTRLPVPHCIKGTEGWRLYGETGRLAEGCLQLEKQTFGSKELFAYLLEHPFDTIAFAGVVTDICVISNAVLSKAARPESRIVVYRDLVASANPQMEEAALALCGNLHMDCLCSTDTL